MLRGMSTWQFQEWRAYADLEPFDEMRADLRAAHIVQTLLNVHRGKGKPPVELEDCVLKFKVSAGQAAPPRTPEQARAEVLRTMRMLTAMNNRPSKTKPKKAPARKGR